MADEQKSVVVRNIGFEAALHRATQLQQRKDYIAGVSGVSFTGPDTAHLSLVELFGGYGRTALDREQLTRPLAFAVSAYCYTAMLWRASRMASAPLMVVQEDDEGEHWVPTHPLIPRLAQPRPDIQMGELLERTQMYRDLTGGALWVDSLDMVGRAALITPYSALEFRTYAVPPLIYGRYEVTQFDGSWKPVDPKLIVHFRETNPASWREPLSKVDAALAQLDLGHNVNRIVKNFLTKAMFPGGIISPDKEWTPTGEEWELWKSQIEAWHGGPANQGKPLIVPGSTVFTPTSNGLTNLLPEAILDRVEATVGSVFGTPPVVLGWLSGMKNSPWSQMSEARRAAYEDTIEPLWQDVERRLTMAWLTPEEQATGLLIRFDTSRITALKDDQERQARIASLTNNVGTLNERRILMGWEPLPPDDPRGDEIVGLRPPQMPGLGLGLGDPNAPDTTQSSQGDATSEEPADLGKSTKSGADTKDLLWLLFDLTTKAHEPAWERVIYAHLQGLKSRLAGIAETHLGGKAKPISSDRAEQAKSELHRAITADKPHLRAKVFPLIAATGGTAVQRLSARLGMTFSRLEPGLAKYAEREADFLADAMGKTTGEAVAKAVQDGLNAGETVRGLVKRLEELPDFDRDRAKMVARTETTRAWNGAQRESLSDFQQSSGARITKSWLSARDDRVREEHQILDDDTYIGIDDVFGNGLTEPGEPNCRCTLLYALEDGTPLGDTQP